MTVHQLSIFIENKSGTLVKVLKLLKGEGIQLIASTIADTAEVNDAAVEGVEDGTTHCGHLEGDVLHVLAEVGERGAGCAVCASGEHQGT